jgi:hypothetical protein
MNAMDADPKAGLEGERIASGLIPAAKVSGADEADTELFLSMWTEANRYIASLPWCSAVIDSYFGGGVGGIFAVFLFHIRPGRAGIDSWIWIMVGDLPPAHLRLADCHSPAEAFEAYIRGMSKWVDLARKGKKGTARQGVPSVPLPATPEWADRLNQRLDGLRLAIRPLFQGKDEEISVED